MDRAAAPVVAVALLVALTVVSASLVGAVALALDFPDRRDPVVVSLTADAAADRLVLVHRRGSALDVSRLSLSVTVDGDALARQPPVPFFRAAGFRSGPTGPFNSAADPRWTAGERAALRVASTNDPTIEPGDPVTVTLRRDGTLIARARTVAN